MPAEDRTGEPTPPLELTPTTVQAGDVLHIRLVGPLGGQATAEFVFLEREVKEGALHEAPEGR